MLNIMQLCCSYHHPSKTFWGIQSNRWQKMHAAPSPKGNLLKWTSFTPNKSLSFYSSKTEGRAHGVVSGGLPAYAAHVWAHHQEAHLRKFWSVLFLTEKYSTLLRAVLHDSQGIFCCVRVSACVGACVHVCVCNWVSLSSTSWPWTQAIPCLNLSSVWV